MYFNFSVFRFILQRDVRVSGFAERKLVSHRQEVHNISISAR